MIQETRQAELEGQREEQRLQASVRKPADARAYEQTTLAKAERDARISAAEAHAREVELQAAANAQRVGLEANADAPKRVPVRGVYVLAPGAIDAAIGPDKHARLRADIAGEEAFFGDIARFVKSDVLMRLRVSSGSPDGVMCFGSRDPQAFGPEQATELLFFLSKVLENTIRAWLDLPE